ncbi:MAG: CRTAC1 family protein [bacterium]
MENRVLVRGRRELTGLRGRMNYRLLLPLAALCLLSRPASAGFTRVLTGDIAMDDGWSYACAWADFTGDGYPDLFLTNNNPAQDRNNSLYVNARDGTFHKVLTGPVVTDGGSSYGCAWGDCDNSGLPDLFVSNYNENNFLYLNTGDSTFTRVTTGRVVTDGGRSTGSAWADYDCDGLLDLFVCNRDQVNFLYRNEGGGQFARITTGAIATDVANSSAAAWADYDNDGLPDLVVADVQSPIRLYRNEGGGQFIPVTSGPPGTDTSHCSGASWGDYDNDGYLDLFVATGVLGMYPDLLYRNNRDGTFTKVTDSPVVNDRTWAGGAAWADVDNDGDLDLFVGGYDGNNRLYLNDGQGEFARIDTGVLVQEGGYIMGVGWADYDRDGHLDLFTARNNYFGGYSRLYRNDGNDNAWLAVVCRGAASNRTGVGARVRAWARIGGRAVGQTREITTQSGGGNSGGSEPVAHFGLGDAAVVDSLVIRWPSGIVDVLAGVAVRQYLVVTEGQTAVREESPVLPGRPGLSATIVRGVLFLPRDPGAGHNPILPGESGLCPKPALLDISGRKVMDLQPGENDVSRLSPGVYFVSPASGVIRGASGAHRVVITR